MIVMDKTVEFLNSLLKDGDVIILGLSGGIDSMCLLEVLLKLDKKIKIVCAHINHNIRIESDNEYVFVKDYCSNKNVIFEYTKFDKKSENIDFNEQELREKRYKFFDEIVKKYDAKYLMTAHHGDDLIETILMRMTRGSNLKGYAGFSVISKKREYYDLVKPLIFCSKNDLINYAKDNNISYVSDLSNNSLKYTRNRYRNKIIPLLKEENKDLHLKYLKYSNELFEYYDYVNRIVINEIDKRYKDNTLDISNFLDLDILIKKKVIENILDSNYYDNLYLVSDIHIGNIIKLIENDKPNIYIYLPDNLMVKKEYNKVIFSREKSSNNGYKYVLEDEVVLLNGDSIRKINDIDSNSNYVIRLDSKELNLPLYVRSREEKDIMYVKNLNGSKKVKDIYIDCKLSKDERIVQPLVVDSNNNVLWIPGIKKSKYDKEKSCKYDIVLCYNKKAEEGNR